MSSIPATAQPAATAEHMPAWRNPLVWGLRVAIVAAVIDIGSQPWNGRGIPEIAALYYERLSNHFILYTPDRYDTGLIGQYILIAALVAIAFGFSYILGQASLGTRGWLRATGATPTAAAVTAASAALLSWSVLVYALGGLTGIAIEATFKYSGGLLFVLLAHTLAFVYAGFAAAGGDADEARRRGALAGLMCGLAVAIAWGAYDFTIYDAGYATLAGVARLVVFGALGYFAGAQGALLWVREGTGRPARVRAKRASGAPRRFRIGGGLLWGAVGLLLLTVFLPKPYSPIDAAISHDATERFAQFGLTLVKNYLVIVAVAVVVAGAVIGLRAAWPALRPVRKAMGDVVRYAVAVGGTGDRIRSRGYARLLIALGLVIVFFWPHIDAYLLPSAISAGTDARVSTLGDMGFYVILALGLNVVVGFAGLLDLGYVAFFAFGAYAWGVLGSPQFATISALVAQLDGSLPLPRLLCAGSACLPWAVLFWPGLLIGALVAAFFGILLGAPTLRLRGDYLAIVTLGFGEIVPIVFRNLDKLDQGVNGISGIATPILPGITFPWIASTTPFYYVMLVLIAVAVVCNLRLRDSRLGRAWVAIREDEIAAAASGINTVRTKLLAFATGAFFSGMAGVYSSSKLGIVAPDRFSFGDSIIYIAMVVLGGIGSIPGVILGAVIIAALNLYILIQFNVFASGLAPSDPLFFIHGIDFSLLRNFIFGGMLIVMMLLRPEGLIPSARRRTELRGDVIAETEAPQLDALDAAVTGPAYVEERIE